MPNGATKLVFLEPGDTLVIRPGHAMVHYVVTLDDSIMAGGMCGHSTVVLP